MKIRAGSWLVAAVAVVATTNGAEAQRRGDAYAYRERVPTVLVGFHLLGADPVGEFAEVVDQGFGLALEGSFPLVGDGALRLRTDGGFIIYGHERKNVCFPVPVGCRIGLDLTTSNTIFFLGAGPEIAVPYGPLRPYVNATAGFSYFATISSLSGDDEWDDWGDTRNFSDFVGSVKLGGGIRALLRDGRKPIHLDLGVQYHRNGVTEYLREGDIVDEPDGSITLYPNRSEANLVTYRIGLSFGIPVGGNDDGWDRRRRR